MPTDLMKNFVSDFYNKNAQTEWERLETPFSRIEFASSFYLIDKYFPKAGKICDIGSGSGRYSIELLKRGFEVTLFDLPENLLRLARQQIENLGFSAENYIVGDARDLSVFGDQSFDAALLMGPLYHIIEARERAGVLQELRRILKPGGRALAVYLNSWGLLRTGISDFPQWYEDQAMLRGMLAEQTFTGDELKNFTECYWATPETALAELEDANFEIISFGAAEGFAGGMRPLIEKLALENPPAYENVVKLAAELCELKQFREMGDHLNFIIGKN